MSRVATKTRKDYVDKICKETRNLALQNKIKQVENFFYMVIASKQNAEEYQKAMFHLLWLVKLNFDIVKWSLDQFLPYNFPLQGSKVESEDCTQTVTDKKTGPPTKKRKTKDQKIPTVQKALQIKTMHSMIKCTRCSPKQTEVVWCEVQTRSADEGGTIFCHCLTCNDRWRL